MSNPTAEKRLPENVCPEHLNDGVNVLICPICHAEQLYAYMQRIVSAKEREMILSENEK